ncbi:hypothetical protein HDU91_005617, partial [Kappamyces sp. JEL0680]
TLVAHEEFNLPDDGTFASGEEMAAYRAHIKTYMGLFSKVVELMITVPQPVAAVVKGHAPAGGTVLALCADVRIGSDAGFTMGLNEVQVGMAPPLWVHRLMLNAVGPRQSASAMQKGQLFNHHQSLEMGLVDKIVPDSQLLEAAKKKIQSYLALPPIARADAKLKSVHNVVQEFSEKALLDVVDSISGPEFQTTVKGILASIGKKK